MKVNELFEGAKATVVYPAPTNKYDAYYGGKRLVKGYDAKRGIIKGVGINSGDFTKEDVKNAYDEVKNSEEFKKASDMMKFNSTKKELQNGTLSWDASTPDDTLVIKVYPSGQVRKHTGPGGYFGDDTRLFQVRSPKPTVVLGDVHKSLVKTYQKAIKAAIQHVKSKTK